MSHTFLKSAQGFFYLKQNYRNTLSVDHFLFMIEVSKIRPTDLLIKKYAQRSFYYKVQSVLTERKDIIVGYKKY